MAGISPFSPGHACLRAAKEQSSLLELSKQAAKAGTSQPSWVAGVTLLLAGGEPGGDAAQVPVHGRGGGRLGGQRGRERQAGGAGADQAAWRRAHHAPAGLTPVTIPPPWFKPCNGLCCLACVSPVLVLSSLFFSTC